MNVFTCKMDIQEENKKIEQECLLKMEELNKSVGSRSSLNFVDKLCNRLNQHEVIVKQEPNDDFIDPVHQTLRTTSPISMPVLENNPAILKVGVSQVKKLLLETHMLTPTFDVSQKNDKSIVEIIEKVKGKLDADDNFNFKSNNDDDNDGPPPLTHVNDLTNLKPFDASVKTIEISGLIKLLKFDDFTVICCLVPPCVFSTENKKKFQKHCKEYHSPTRLRNSTLCENCGVEIISDANMNLLESVFAHTMAQHEDLLVNQPKPRTRMLRLRKLSGDALSVVKSGDIKKENEKININDNNQNNYISKTEKSETSTNISNTLDDNPFSFKISGIMSLADPERQPPPLTPITKPNMQIIVKEAKLTTSELAKSKKSEKATKKFIEEVEKLYKCPHYYCLFATYFREYLEKHLKTHKTEIGAMIPCIYCDLKTPWEHLAAHIDIRHANCKYACSYCLYRACLKDYVFLHQEKMHPNQEYVVIALPTPKVQKKFAIADVKIDPKSLCSPYICQPNCNLQFLFENEFREHVRCTHLSSLITCGHKQCSSRVPPSEIIQHWSTAHDVSIYQCGYCKTNSNELQMMYYHLSQMHQNLNPEILVRLAIPIPSVTLGYSPEAFKRMFKIASVHAPVDSNKQVSIKLLEKDTVGQSSEGESDNQKSDKFKKQCGLLGYQLYRCAFCEFSCSNTTDFKGHVTKSVSCKLDDQHKPFMCVHCKKQFKLPQALGDHIQCHGILRYTCSLCGNKFASPTLVRIHMKHRHNINQTTQTALNTEEVCPSNQEYIIKPKLMLGDMQSKDNGPADSTRNVLKIEQTYFPDIPTRSIFSSDLRPEKITQEMPCKILEMQSSLKTIEQHTRKSHAQRQKEYRERLKKMKIEENQNKSKEIPEKKTKAQYQKEYRERLKAKQNMPEKLTEEIPCKILKMQSSPETIEQCTRKSQAQRQREYRERLKKKKNEANQNTSKEIPQKKTRAQYQKEYRERLKAKQKISIPNIFEVGPTVTNELKYSDILHMKEIEEEMGKIKAEKTYEKSNITEVLVPEVINPDMIDESEQDGTVLEMSCQSSETHYYESIDNVNDLMVVTKTDKNVPNVGDAFCCEYCPHMFDSEILVVSHITSQHEHMHIKFKILNQDQCENKL